MKYPFTIIFKRNLPIMFKTLKSLGYYFRWSLDIFQVAFENVDIIYVVIDNAGVFGNACFYSRRTQLDPTILRTFIADDQEFLIECANLKGETEF